MTGVMDKKNMRRITLLQTLPNDDNKGRYQGPGIEEVRARKTQEQEGD